MARGRPPKVKPPKSPSESRASCLSVHLLWTLTLSCVVNSLDSSPHQNPHSRKSASMKSPEAIDDLFENMDWKEGLVSTQCPGRHAAPQVLRNVVIPARKRSPLGSSLSSVRDLSSEYDTPATSTTVTPAELLPKAERGHMTLSKLGGVRCSTGATASKGKRKRLNVNVLMEADAKLAQALQAQEYSGEKSRGSLSKKSSKLVIEDSDEDEPLEDLNEVVQPSALEEDSSLDIPLAKSKRRRIGVQSRLPSRADRDSARESLTDKRSGQVFDSEESELPDVSAISTFAPEEAESDALEDSDDDEDLKRPSDILATTQPTASASVAGQTHASAARRGRRAAGATRRGRGWQGARDDRATRERRKLEKAHPEIKTMWDTLKAVPLIATALVEQPATINRTLKSFQLEGLGWMMKQEKSQWKGGLLGDEMGMGKTIQAVSLIMSDYPAKDPTLVVVPPVALMQWQNEINQYTDGKLKVCIYHNSDPKVKQLAMKDLKKYDVIMISYAGLESIYRKESKGWKRDDGLVKENSKIHAIHYHRLILDEAHNIKTRTTGVAKACFALKADYKWCLSGTPVQNRIGEFFSLLRFLQITPFACYFCKKCPCAELHWQQDETKRCSSCNHTGFEHVSIFNQELLNPITQGQDPELRREALGKLRMVTDRIMLRRMKRDHTASMELPPKEVIIHNEFFGEIERDFSSSIMSNTTRQFDTYVSRGVMLNNYANIFGLIMQMRQVAKYITPSPREKPYFDVALC